MSQPVEDGIGNGGRGDCIKQDRYGQLACYCRGPDSASVVEYLEYVLSSIRLQQIESPVVRDKQVRLFELARKRQLAPIRPSKSYA